MYLYVYTLMGKWSILTITTVRVEGESKSLGLHFPDDLESEIGEVSVGR